MWAIQWWSQSEEGDDILLFLVAAVKRLKITISDNDAYSTDVLYDQRYYKKFTRDYKPGESNREDKDSIEKATTEKGF